ALAVVRDVVDDVAVDGELDDAAGLAERAAGGRELRGRRGALTEDRVGGRERQVERGGEDADLDLLLDRVGGEVAGAAGLVRHDGAGSGAVEGHGRAVDGAL